MIPLQVKLTEEIVEELLYFSDMQLPAKTLEDTGNNKITFALLFKRSNDNLTGNIDDVVLQMVYGNSRKPPGDEKSPAFKLKKVWNDSGRPKGWDDVKESMSEADNQESVLLGIWAPPNSLSKAMVLKHLFPNLSNPFKMPDLTEVPLHVAIAYDAFKAKDVFELSQKYPGKVMSYGYFSSDVPGEAQLLGKTTEKYDSRVVPVTYQEKLVIQLAKNDPHCFMDFIDLGPSYMSTDVEIGELDCKFFFPPGYNTPEAEIITYLKKKTKRKGKMGRFKITDQMQDGDTQSVITGTDVDNSMMGDQNGEENVEDTVIGDEANNEDSEEEDNEDCERNETNENQDGLESADKATSPVTES